MSSDSGNDNLIDKYNLVLDELFDCKINNIINLINAEIDKQIMDDSNTSSILSLPDIQSMDDSFYKFLNTLEPKSKRKFMYLFNDELKRIIKARGLPSHLPNMYYYDNNGKYIDFVSTGGGSTKKNKIIKKRKTKKTRKTKGRKTRVNKNV